MHRSTLYAAVVFSVLGAACSVALADESELRFGYAPVAIGIDGQGPDRLNGVGFGVSGKPAAVNLRGGFFLAATDNTPQNVAVGIGFDAEGPVVGFHAGFGTQWETPQQNRPATNTASNFARADITLRF
jgi:hypothetical protein